MNDTACVTFLTEEDIRKLIADVYDVSPCKVKLDSSFNGGIYAKIDSKPDPNKYIVNMARETLPSGFTRAINNHWW